MAAVIAPPPYQSTLVEDQGRGPLRGFFMTAVWVQWFLRSLIARVQTSPQILTVVQLESQNASIGTTSIPTESLAAGEYFVSYYLRVTTVASVNSSIAVTFGWTEDTTSQTFPGAAVTGNLTTSKQSGVFMVDIDQASPITYATTYASTLAGEMKYKLKIALWRLN